MCRTIDKTNSRTRLFFKVIIIHFPSFSQEAFAKADPRLKALMYSALKEIKGDNVPWTSGDWRSALSAGCDHLDNRRMANIESLEIVGEK